MDGWDTFWYLILRHSGMDNVWDKEELSIIHNIFFFNVLYFRKDYNNYQIIVN